MRSFHTFLEVSLNNIACPESSFYFIKCVFYVCSVIFRYLYFFGSNIFTKQSGRKVIGGGVKKRDIQKKSKIR